MHKNMWMFLFTIVGISLFYFIQKDDDIITKANVIIYTDGKTSSEKEITDLKTLQSLQRVFTKIEWNRYIEVKMVRQEDAELIMFRQVKQHMPEKTLQYRIWFEHADVGATIISSDPEENIGTLNKNDAETLEDIIYQK
ncbi:hypothetical protein JEG43_03385 [Anoxybacillus sp. LAT_35]|uniref:hypothetical protein n=1 Tax=unclassified Anoxybacillus TaxID=2639704 RepID=UPI001EDAB40F|nr:MULTISPECIES: hypothetical protein [unclassified Anoxybacillus]MCG5024592.1 hypothetical protein [Anoxybacillus flavithermus]MCG6196119.1 hypothetical protein [Anoxybacillus sp. LAT_38]MCG3083342.1 hypothetical protein [Anoxybacillus sp. LAT27]MCG6172219.1 hypothetical protein [Anoxybacillus sp. LAT_11]MCG6174363.1 hypothetical protein [Anoxybacillus sp. LAT_31]